MLKTELRDIAKDCRCAFDITGDTVSLLEAVAAYAAYKATGGKKLIALPPFTDIIYNIIYETALILSKSGKKIKSSHIEYIKSVLPTKINNISRIEYAMSTIGVNMIVVVNNKENYIQVTNMESLMVRIAYIAISGLNDTRFNNEDVLAVLCKYFSQLGRM